MTVEINIGKNIKRYLNKQGFSQEDLAKESGVKCATVTKIEINVIKKLSVLITAKLAKVFSV
jgi:transcriptional regulator with XRE-family HTH domain